MKSSLPALLSFLTLLTISTPAADWREWRGPNQNGVAESGQTPPTSWSESSNVIWKADIPGQGHSSPTLVGNRLFITAANNADQTQSVLCYSRDSGELLWQRTVAKGQFAEKIHKKNTQASPTPASDGERVFVTFNSGEVIYVAAFDLEGNELWKKSAGDYKSQFPFGYGASPILYKEMVIVTAESKSGYIAAFDRKTGSEVWRAPRNKWTSYSTPVIANLAGKDQLVLSGNNRITSFDPNTGKMNWESRGSTKSTCGTVVWDGDVVFASGGFPGKETVAMKADGTGKVVWKNNTKVYEQSMLVHDGYLYALDDNGIVYCWSTSDGRTMWRERLGGPVSSSPILAGGLIYASNERGQTFVFKPNPNELDLVATNQLGDDIFATPTIVDSRIYLRVGNYKGETRSETLYCLGKP
ncbi:MAG: PQQ-binding-like beta-propeller repeat protein [Verrucomicrobiota bacterium]